MEIIRQRAHFVENPQKTNKTIKLISQHRLAWLLILVSGLSTLSFANTDTEAEAKKLDRIRTEINMISAAMQKDLDSRDSLQSKLRDSEKQLDFTNRELKTLNKAIAQKQAKLGSLNKQQQSLGAQLDLQQQSLSRQVLSAYKIGRQEQIKLLLNQTQPEALNRVLSYYRYFNQARITLMQDVKQQIEQINHIKKEVSIELAELETLDQQKQSASNKLKQTLKKRQNLLAKINRHIDQYGLQIEQLQADEKRVRALIQSLNGLLNDIPTILPDLPFSSQKGRLDWPTQGTIIHQFGDPRGNSDLVWQGISIQAPAGQAILAISHGRVAFADWLQGFGLLLIIDHQDGFMSLYAHNQTLFKDTGEWVNQGEIIANVGNTGGLSDPQLYLEIRQQGAPLNPESWFKTML